MRVLVTGATGRVGANMVKRLLAAGADVKAMVMPGDPQAKKVDELPGVQAVEASLTDQDAINGACADVTHVVHLAAQMVRGDTPPDEYFDINSFGTLRLLEGVVRAGGVQRFLLASTDGTYRPGDPPAIPLTEDTPQRPADRYGTSKLLGEVILRSYAAQFDIPYAVTRFATVLSPEEAGRVFTLDSMRGLLGLQALGRDSNIWQLFRDQPNLLEILDAAAGDAAGDTAVALLGPDDSPWTIHLVDVRDAVEGVYLALTVPEAEGGAFNITAAAPTSHTEGAATVAELFGVPKLEVRMPLRWQLEMATAAARDTLGHRPKYDYRGMLESARTGGDYIPALV